MSESTAVEVCDGCGAAFDEMDLFEMSDYRHLCENCMLDALAEGSTARRECL